MALRTAKPAMISAIGERRHLVGQCRVSRFVAGMTLMELLVVLGIIAIVVGMSVPALSRYAGDVRLKSTTRQLVGLLSLARSLSIGSPAGHCVVIDQSHRQVTIVDNATGETLDQKMRLPSGIEIVVETAGEAVTPAELVFQPNGALRSRTMTFLLRDARKTHTITVSGATGAIHVE